MKTASLVLLSFLLVPLLLFAFGAPTPVAASSGAAFLVARHTLAVQGASHPARNKEQPTAVTLARIQVVPAYPLFGIVGSLILIALVLIFRVYRSI